MSKTLEELKERKKKLEAQIRKAEATERTKKRKTETRRKIILGGALLAVEDEKGINATLDDVYLYIGKTLTRQADRVLFFPEEEIKQQEEKTESPTENQD